MWKQFPRLKLAGRCKRRGFQGGKGCGDSSKVYNSYGLLQVFRTQNDKTSSFIPDIRMFLHVRQLPKRSDALARISKVMCAGLGAGVGKNRTRKIALTEKFISGGWCTQRTAAGIEAHMADLEMLERFVTISEAQPRPNVHVCPGE
jgi:hypothetical protein